MKKLGKEDKAGLYITVIFHLTVVIVLLIAQIGAVLQKENTFVLDFSRQDEIEKAKKEEAFQEDISKRIDDLLAASEAGNISFRNVSVNRSALKDDRGTDAEELYKEAERLQRELENGQHQEQDDGFVDYQPKQKDEKKVEEQAYSGPSVLSWELEGRKASRLKVPAYLGYGAGMVTVIITVDNQGNVINAKVEEALSSPDQGLRSYAIRAARNSKFSASSTAPARQIGNIVYQFIAQ